MAADASGLVEAIAEAPDEEYNTASNGNDLLPGYDQKNFPDVLTIGSERFQCPEALFNPTNFTGKDLLIPGVQKMVEQTVSAVAMDLVKPLYRNVMLSGGTTMLTGFAERFRTELDSKTPPGITVNVVAPPQRHFAVWTGRSNKY